MCATYLPTVTPVFEARGTYMRAVGVKGEGLFPSFGMRTCDQVDKVAVRNEMRYFVSNHIYSVADYRRAETRTTPPRVIKWFRHGRRTEELFGDNIMVGKDDWWRRRRTESNFRQLPDFASQSIDSIMRWLIVMRRACPGRGQHILAPVCSIWCT